LLCACRGGRFDAGHLDGRCGDTELSRESTPTSVGDVRFVLQPPVDVRVEALVVVVGRTGECVALVLRELGWATGEDGFDGKASSLGVGGSVGG
jgi:hypothetical protein